ncbi:MAG: TonB-dependent receptor [Pseudomonadales bacterium]|nr:TonB-dependent receptor [Pseudomonadales bacterium]
MLRLVEKLTVLRGPGGGLIVFAALVGSAHAQPVLEEVIVTATKRSESVQSLPQSVSSIPGEELRDRGLTEFFDYAVTIPNLSFGAATDGILSNRSISLRGIEGTNTTGFYIDDTPITETIDPRILDLERIEVLRGPSGTLYGARSLGGTIRQITRRPSADGMAGWIRAELSSTKESGGANSLLYGSVNAPLGEHSAVVFSGLFEDRAGVFDRRVGTIANHLSAPATLSGAPSSVVEDVDGQQVTAMQAHLLVEPTDALAVTARIMRQTTNLDGFPLADVRSDNFDQNRDFDVDEGGEDEWTLMTLNVNYTTDHGRFTSATSRFARETFEVEASGSFINFLQALPGAAGGFGLFDVIGVRPVTSPIFQTLNFETFVQEVRFASDLDGSVNYVAGVFYQDTSDDEAFQPRNYARGLNDNFAALKDTLGIPGPLAAVWPFGDLVFTSSRPTDVEESGVFGEVELALGDRFSAVVGSRWFDTSVTFTEQQAGLAAGVPLAEDMPLSSIPPEGGSQNEDGFIFKGAVEYRATDDLFFYALVAEGFRLGGANGTIPNTLGCPEDLAALGLAGVDTSRYESDNLVSFEAGVKADLGPATRVNATLFSIDFDGIQQRIQLTCGFQFRGNFGAARSRGVELEFMAKPSGGLLLALNVGYTDAQFTETVAGINQDGDPLQFVPELTASLVVDYLRPDAMFGMDFFVRADLNHVGESQSRVNAIPRQRDAYQQVGVRLGLANERYRVALVARNLTNEIANLGDNRSIAAETPGRPRWVVSRPRSIGLELGADF